MSINFCPIFSGHRTETVIHTECSKRGILWESATALIHSCRFQLILLQEGSGLQVLHNQKDNLKERPIPPEIFFSLLQLACSYPRHPTLLPRLGKLHWRHSDIGNTEWLRLEGTSGDHLAQRTAQSRISYSRLHRTWPKWALSISKDGDSTPSKCNNQSLRMFFICDEPINCYSDIRALLQFEL